jgi:hypothetical protein
MFSQDFRDCKVSGRQSCIEDFKAHTTEAYKAKIWIWKSKDSVFDR